jgi:hyperosmotically inducible protein
MSLPWKALSPVRLHSLNVSLVVATMCLGPHTGYAAPDTFLVAANTATDTSKNSADRSVGIVVDDSVITAKVKSALIADDDVKAFDISVKTRQGEVVLSGFVDSQSQVDRAVDIASSVGGVKTVSNRLTVKK